MEGHFDDRFDSCPTQINLITSSFNEQDDPGYAKDCATSRKSVSMMNFESVQSTCEGKGPYFIFEEIIFLDKRVS